MRIIFLDFDGVLNAASDEPAGGEMWSADWLDRSMVLRLSGLAARGRASVVVSSSWRQRRSLSELAAILAARGFAGEVLDVTPRLPRPLEGERFVRLAEVSAWLAAAPHVESFVILDDDQEFGPLARHHVQTNAKVGLTDEDAAKALDILQR